jgi:uncharacterized protein (UPF0297 family)
MLIVYVAGPFRAGTNYNQQEENIRAAEAAGLQIAKEGMAPLIPHTMYRFFQGALPDEFWLRATLALLRRCHALYLLPTWKESQGACAERDDAEAHGIPIFEDLNALYLWRSDKEFGEYLATSSGSFIHDFILHCAEELASFGPDACNQLVQYMRSGVPTNVSKDNAGKLGVFLSSFSRHEMDTLAIRLKDVYGAPLCASK